MSKLLSASRLTVLGFTLAVSAAFAQETPSNSAPAPTPAPAPSTPAAPQDPSTVVARVGTEEITLGDFEQQYRVYVGRLVNNQGIPFTTDVLPYFNEYRPEILSQVARQRGLLQLARGVGIESDAAKVEETVASNKKGFENDAEFVKALQQSGYNDEAQLRQIIADGLQTSAYVESVRGRFTFSDLIVNGYYQTHRKDFQREAQACVKHILVKDEAAAAAAKTRLDAGEDFAKVAQDVSLDPGSKDEGGDLGCLKQGVTVPEFDRASFTGPVGQVQQVKSQFGVHLLVVSKRTTAGLAPLADVQDEIRQTLAGDAAQRYINSQLTRLKVLTYADKVAAATPPK